jgi:hypothetical protein
MRKGNNEREPQAAWVACHLDSLTRPPHYAFVILTVCATGADSTFKA